MSFILLSPKPSAPSPQPPTPSHQLPIAVFDSGVGGLSVLRHLHKLLPNENIIYLGDQANIPYGQKSVEEIINYSEGIVEFFIKQGARLIVVACNTATAAAINHLRKKYDVPFVGMEPALKPAVKNTKSKVVGVLATEATFESQRYAQLMAEYAKDVRVLENPCVGLVELIENGKVVDLESAVLLHRAITPMRNADADVLVLGCTHYPFVTDLISAVSDNMIIIDPAPAVAKQVARRLAGYDLLTTEGKGSVRYITTGDTERFRGQIKTLLGEDVEGEVESAVWRDQSLFLYNDDKS